MIEFELTSICFVNLKIDLRKSFANDGIPLETNMLLALYGLEIQRSRRNTLLYICLFQTRGPYKKNKLNYNYIKL